MTCRRRFLSDCKRRDLYPGGMSLRLFSVCIPVACQAFSLGCLILAPTIKILNRSHDKSRVAPMQDSSERVKVKVVTCSEYSTNGFQSSKQLLKQDPGKVLDAPLKESVVSKKMSRYDTAGQSLSVLLITCILLI